MAKFGPRGVRWRLTVSVSVLFAIALIGGGVVFLEQIESELIEDVHSSARLELERVLSTLPSDGDVPFPESDGAGITTMKVLESSDGSLVAVAQTVPGVHAEAGDTEIVPSDGDNIASAAMIRSKILEQGEPIPRWLAVEDGRIAITSISTDTPSGRFQLLSASPLDAVQQTVDTARRVLIAAVPILIGMIGLTAWAVAGRALQPVEAITRRADDIGLVSSDARLPVPETRDEVAHLARTLNGMLDRLEQAAKTQRRFTADAAHELRTPISTIRTELEVALRNDDPEWSAVAERALTEDIRLGALVDDLVLLARGDEALRGSGEVSDPTVGTIDLEAVALEAAERRNGIPIGVDNVSPAQIRGDAIEVGRAITHLLDNAVRHAEEKVEVVLEASGDQVLLHVDDDGSGIPPNERKRVLERFARLDEARSRDQGGAGLGLAVVNQIMTRHQGEVIISDSPIGGARITLSFPGL